MTTGLTAFTGPDRCTGQRRSADICNDFQRQAERVHDWTGVVSDAVAAACATATATASAGAGADEAAASCPSHASIHSSARAGACGSEPKCRRQTLAGFASCPTTHARSSGTRKQSVTAISP